MIMMTDRHKPMRNPNAKILEQKTATAVVVKLPNGTYRLGDEKDITIGERIKLLLPNDTIVTTSPVQEWRKYGGFYITTMNTQYFVTFENE